jgi:hypothetical protein
MRSFSRPCHPFWGVACVLLFLVGCNRGTPTVKLEGKIVKDGTAISLGQGESLTLSFGGTDAAGKPADVGAAVEPDGTFVVSKIPVGKYKLKVGIASSSNDPAGLAQMAKLNKEFEAANAKLEYDVTSDSNQQLTVDAGKGTVTKR